MKLIYKIQNQTLIMKLSNNGRYFYKKKITYFQIESETEKENNYSTNLGYGVWENLPTTVISLKNTLPKD